MKIIKIIFLIIWTLWCFLGILKNYSHYSFADWAIVLILTIFPYIVVYFISRKKHETVNRIAKKNTSISNSKKMIPPQGISTQSVNRSTSPLFDECTSAKSADVKSEVNPLSTAPVSPDFHKEQAISYIETENTIYRTDGKPISERETSYLIQIGQEKAIAQWKIPELERQMKESYQLMCTTNNPETLCNRYKFMVERINELAYFEQNGAFDKDNFAQYKALITDDNYRNLILVCYTKYINKARAELSTQKGINNRIDKFWKTIRQNVNAEFYNKMFLTKM